MVECEVNLERCVKCNRLPMVVKEVGDLWYVVCGCKKWDKCEFLGRTEKLAIENWNYLNRPLNRSRSKKNEM